MKLIKRLYSDISIYLFPLLVVIVGLVASYYAYTMIWDWHIEASEAEEDIYEQTVERQISTFEHRAQLRHNAIMNQFERNLETLYVLREFFRASEFITWNDFREFVAITLSRHPEVSGYFWIPLVETGDLVEFSRASSMPDFAGKLPEEARRTPTQLSGPIWPIYYASPLSDNRQWVGKNAHEHPLFKGAMARARETNQPSVTYPFATGATGQREQSWIFLPVETELTLARRSGRQVTGKRGVVASGMNIPALVEAALQPFQEDRLQFYVFDGGGNLLTYHGSDPAPSPDSITPGDLRGKPGPFPIWEETLSLADTNWLVMAVSTTPRIPKIGTSTSLIGQAWSALFLGILVTILTAGYLFTLLREISRRRQAEARLRKLARRDPLTDLLNRRTFGEELKQEFEREERYDRPLTVMMFDLDHFKEINDTYGHSAGDEVLETFSEILRENIRKPDYAGRHGGEEFVLCLPETGEEESLSLAERIREQLNEHTFQADGETFQVSCSIGVAEKTEETQTPEDLIKHADEAMYKAKESGRDRTVLA